MTQEEFDKAPKIEQVLYDCTGMLAKNHSDIIEAMTLYAESGVKKFHKPPVRCSVCGCNPKTSHWLDKKTGKDMCMKCGKEIAN